MFVPYVAPKKLSSVRMKNNTLRTALPLQPTVPGSNFESYRQRALNLQRAFLQSRPRTLLDPGLNPAVAKRYQDQLNIDDTIIRSVTQTVGGMAGALAGATVGWKSGSATGAAVMAGLGIAVPAPEEIATVPLGSLIGGIIGSVVGAVSGAFTGAALLTMPFSRSAQAAMADMVRQGLLQAVQQPAQAALGAMSTVGYTLDQVFGAAAVKGTILGLQGDGDSVLDRIFKAYGADKEGFYSADFTDIRKNTGIDIGPLGNGVIDFLGELVTDPSMWKTNALGKVAKLASDNAIPAIIKIGQNADELGSLAKSMNVGMMKQTGRLLLDATVDMQKAKAGFSAMLFKSDKARKAVLDMQQALATTGKTLSIRQISDELFQELVTKIPMNFGDLQKTYQAMVHNKNKIGSQVDMFKNDPSFDITKYASDTVKSWLKKPVNGWQRYKMRAGIGGPGYNLSGFDYNALLKNYPVLRKMEDFDNLVTRTGWHIGDPLLGITGDFVKGDIGRLLRHMGVSKSLSEFWSDASNALTPKNQQRKMFTRISDIVTAKESNGIITYQFSDAYKAKYDAIKKLNYDTYVKEVNDLNFQKAQEKLAITDEFRSRLDEFKVLRNELAQARKDRKDMIEAIKKMKQTNVLNFEGILIDEPTYRLFNDRIKTLDIEIKNLEASKADYSTLATKIKERNEYRKAISDYNAVEFTKKATEEQMKLGQKIKDLLVSFDVFRKSRLLSIEMSYADTTIPTKNEKGETILRDYNSTPKDVRNAIFNHMLESDKDYIAFKRMVHDQVEQIHEALETISKKHMIESEYYISFTENLAHHSSWKNLNMSTDRVPLQSVYDRYARGARSGYTTAFTEAIQNTMKAHSISYRNTYFRKVKSGSLHDLFRRNTHQLLDNILDSEDASVVALFEERFKRMEELVLEGNIDKIAKAYEDLIMSLPNGKYNKEAMLSMLKGDKVAYEQILYQSATEYFKADAMETWAEKAKEAPAKVKPTETPFSKFGMLPDARVHNFLKMEVMIDGKKTPLFPDFNKLSIDNGRVQYSSREIEIPIKEEKISTGARYPDGDLGVHEGTEIKFHQRKPEFDTEVISQGAWLPDFAGVYVNGKHLTIDEFIQSFTSKKIRARMTELLGTIRDTSKGVASKEVYDEIDELFSQAVLESGNYTFQKAQYIDALANSRDPVMLDALRHFYDIFSGNSDDTFLGTVIREMQMSGAKFPREYNDFMKTMRSHFNMSELVELARNEHIRNLPSTRKNLLDKLEDLRTRAGKEVKNSYTYEMEDTLAKLGMLDENSYAGDLFDVLKELDTKNYFALMNEPINGIHTFLKPAEFQSTMNQFRKSHEKKFADAPWLLDFLLVEMQRRYDSLSNIGPKSPYDGAKFFAELDSGFLTNFDANVQYMADNINDHIRNIQDRYKNMKISETGAEELGILMNQLADFRNLANSLHDDIKIKLVKTKLTNNGLQMYMFDSSFVQSIFNKQGLFDLRKMIVSNSPVVLRQPNAMALNSKLKRMVYDNFFTEGSTARLQHDAKYRAAKLGSDIGGAGRNRDSRTVVSHLSMKPTHEKVHLALVDLSKGRPYELIDSFAYFNRYGWTSANARASWEYFDDIKSQVPDIETKIDEFEQMLRANSDQGLQQYSKDQIKAAFTRYYLYRYNGDFHAMQEQLKNFRTKRLGKVALQRLAALKEETTYDTWAMKKISELSSTEQTLRKRYFEEYDLIRPMLPEFKGKPQLPETWLTSEQEAAFVGINYRIDTLSARVANEFPEMDDKAWSIWRERYGAYNNIEASRSIDKTLEFIIHGDLMSARKALADLGVNEYDLEDFIESVQAKIESKYEHLGSGHYAPYADGPLVLPTGKKQIVRGEAKPSGIIPTTVEPVIAELAQYDNADLIRDIRMFLHLDEDGLLQSLKTKLSGDLEAKTDALFDEAKYTQGTLYKAARDKYEGAVAKQLEDSGYWIDTPRVKKIAKLDEHYYCCLQDLAQWFDNDAKRIKEFLDASPEYKMTAIQVDDNVSATRRNSRFYKADFGDEKRLVEQGIYLKDKMKTRSEIENLLADAESKIAAITSETPENVVVEARKALAGARTMLRKYDEELSYFKKGEYDTHNPAIKEVLIDDVDGFQTFLDDKTNMLSNIGLMSVDDYKVAKRLSYRPYELPGMLRRYQETLERVQKSDMLQSVGYHVRNVVDTARKNSNMMEGVWDTEDYLRTMGDAADLYTLWDHFKKMQYRHLKHLDEQIEAAKLSGKLDEVAALTKEAEDISTLGIMKYIRERTDNDTLVRARVAKRWKNRGAYKNLLPEEQTAFLNERVDDYYNMLNLTNMYQNTTATTDVVKYMQMLETQTLHDPKIKRWQIEMVKYLAQENPITKANMHVGTMIEQVGRLHGFLLDQHLFGGTFDQSVARSLKRHYDYSDMGMLELYSTVFFPFASFTARNYLYWSQELMEAAVTRRYVHMINAVWGSYDGPADSEYVASAKINGYIPLGNTLLKLGDSRGETLTASINAGQYAKSRLNPLFRESIAQLTQNRTGMDMLSAIPYLRRIPQVARAITANKNGRNLQAVLPSVFGTLYTDADYRFPAFRARRNVYNELYTRKGNRRATVSTGAYWRTRQIMYEIQRRRYL